MEKNYDGMEVISVTFGRDSFFTGLRARSIVSLIQGRQAGRQAGRQGKETI